MSMAALDGKQRYLQHELVQILFRRCCELGREFSRLADSDNRAILLYSLKKLFACYNFGLAHSALLRNYPLYGYFIFGTKGFNYMACIR